MEYRKKEGRIFVKIKDEWIEVTPKEFADLNLDESNEKLEELAEKKKEEQKNKGNTKYNSFFKEKYIRQSALDSMVNEMMNELANADYLGLAPKIISISIKKVEKEPEETEKESLVEVIDQGKDYLVIIQPSKLIVKEKVTKLDYNPKDNMLTINYRNANGEEEEYKVKIEKIKGKARKKEININNGVLELILEKEE